MRLDDSNKEYFLAGPGTICTDSNFNRIEGVTECRNAAKTMGKIFRSSRIEDDADYPTGCYIYSEVSNRNSRAVYFNTNTNNRRNRQGNPICIGNIETKNVNYGEMLMVICFE